VLEAFREDISIFEGKAREYLAKFMFFKKSPFKKVKHLSGGERIRLKLAMLLYQDINLLILDEPTNHLDIDSIETLEEALEDFKGTIFFISHDRYFINKIAERVIALEDYGFKSYQGNYHYYKSQQPKEVPIVNREKDKKQRIKTESLNQEELSANALTRIESLEKEIKAIDLAMSDDQIEYDELTILYSKKIELSKELDSVMELWLS
jgi:ATP-binding cassette, subfamily F, member 3